MRRTAEGQKRKLLDGLMEAIQALPEDQASVVSLGTWSVKDLVAHLIGWDATNLEAVQTILAGSAPNFFGFYDKDWQSYNRLLVAKYRKDSLTDLLADAESSHHRFIEFLNALPAKDVVHGKAARPNGRSVSIRSLLQAEAQDEAVHRGQVQAFSQPDPGVAVP